MIVDLPRHLTGIAVIALAAFILWGMFHWELAEANREVAFMVCGVAIGWAGSVVNYHFGTSEGSKRKTDLIAKQSKGEGYAEETKDS
tara:strand:- start:2091 stop:2351 length:261 start_codon:yes stop_codon:yes gene_type:complete